MKEAIQNRVLFKIRDIFVYIENYDPMEGQ